MSVCNCYTQCVQRHYYYNSCRAMTPGARHRPASNTPTHATDSKQSGTSVNAPAADVQRLEQAFRRAAVASPEPLGAPQSADASSAKKQPWRSLLQQQQQQLHQGPLQLSAAPSSSSSSSTDQQQLSSLLQAGARALFIRRVLPVARAVRAAERKLEARLPAVGNSILLMAAVIMYDLGVNNVLDRLLGDSPLGSVSCVLVGLGMVLGVKLAGFKVLDFWEV